MPTWREVIESEDYQVLPLGEKIKTKNEFFRNIISQSSKFGKLSPQERMKTRTDFFTPKPEERLMPFLPEKPSLKQIGRFAIEEFQQKSPFALLDKPVEEVAKFIEPDTAQEGAIGALKFIPRQMLAEIVRSYKPSTVGLFGLATQAVKPIAKPVAKFIASKIPEPIKKLALKELTIGKGQPQAYQQMAKEALLERQAGGREAEKVAITLTAKPTGELLTPEEQRYLGRIFRKETIESPQLLAHPRYQELKAISNEGRAIMDKWSTELAKSGIPKEQTRKVIEENIGQYMARMYTTKLKPETGMFGAIKNLRLRLGGLKHRKDLSESVLRQLGEIKEPALPTAIRVKEISANIANNNLFSKVAQNSEWVADKNITGNLIKMPDTVNIGALKGKWVIPEIGEDINAIVNAGQQSQGIYSKLLSAWKFGKVALNPATQVRNAISNTMLLDLSGTSHLRQVRLFPKAFTEYLSKGKIYQQAIEDGAVGGEFIGGEIKKLKDFYLGVQGGNLQKWLNILKLPFDKAGKMYQGMEQVAKIVKYMDVLEKGGTRQIAADEAQKWLFDYSKVPNIVDWARKSLFGAPFITFTYKSTPRIVEALVNRPLSVYKYYALFNAFNETSRKYQGMLPTEYARQKRLLPPYLLKDIGGIPTNLFMPYRDKYNRTQWLNLEYILPLGQSPEILEKGLSGWVGNPIFNLVADLSKNSDFRGKPIIPLQSTPQEATKTVISHIYRQLAPSLAPALPMISKGGYSYEKIMDAIIRRPDFVERVRELTPVLLDTLMGLKINVLDVDEAEKFRMFDKKNKIEELQKQVLRLNHPAISEQEREKQAEIIFQKMQKVINGF